MFDPGIAVGNPLSTWTNSLTQLAALSVATERVTETIKQWIGSAPQTEQQASKRTWIVQLIAIASGCLVVILSGLNPLNLPDFVPYKFSSLADWCYWLLTGLLVSGGSAVWNHLLDILKATKVDQEAKANDATQAVGKPAIPA